MGICFHCLQKLNGGAIGVGHNSNISIDVEAVEYDDLRDYKFFCFNGEVKCFKIDFGRNTEHYANYYNPQGELLPFGEACYPPIYDRQEEIPSNLTEMISIAEMLSRDHRFLRVDLYNVHGRIYFGELTFYPGSGVSAFTDNRWDLIMGEWISMSGQ